jgi:major vault protein
MSERYDPRSARAANELVLSDGTFAYTQDTTKGNISIHTGPTVVNVTGQEFPVTHKDGLFVEVALDKAVQRSPLVPQGYYVVLDNPAVDSGHPNERSKQSAAELRIGERVNIPGPVAFSLWPRQAAKVIKGHQLRSNEYLLVRVYDEESALENWGSAVVKLAQTQDSPNGASDSDDADEGVLSQDVLSASAADAPTDLSVGAQFVIRGTEVSFYIPPTGVEVVPDDEGNYVRNAITLERLEYCILIDENGNKRYERGPSVIFPTPTETFFSVETKDGRQMAFRPVELNPIQGIHVKVIADYTEEDKTERKEGEELFITGKTTQIYFPREEHSLISYDRQSKHYATVVAAGEGRYVLERMTGKINMVKGEDMLLPDPRTQVIVRRVLSDRQCEMWYPGNTEALEYNRDMRDLQSRTPTSRSGSVSEGEVKHSRKLRSKATRSIDSAQMQSSNVGAPSYAALADEFSRGSTYTQPRMVTLNTKFQGVPTIGVWTNYAVMVVDAQGNRRVEVGPNTILLGYDEDLEVLQMSTGKPKTTDRLVSTVYLRVKNNQVSDIIAAETKDHVQVRIKVSYSVNFFGEDPSKWFEVENYVKYLCDHVRSVLKSSVRKVTIEEFYSKSEDFVRDTVIGAKPEEGDRPGMVFDANNMKIDDVEILAVDIPDQRIRTLLEEAQHTAVASNIELARTERQLKDDLRKEEISRERLDATDLTVAHKTELQKKQIERSLMLALESVASDLKKKEEARKLHAADEELTGFKHEQNLVRMKADAEQALAVQKAHSDLELERIAAETKATVDRFDAGAEGLSEALLALQNQETMIKVAQALSVQTMVGGESFTDVVKKVFGDSPVIANLLANAAKKAIR